VSLCLTNYALRHEDAWWSRYIDPHFLGLGASLRWVISFMPLPLYRRGKCPGIHWIGGWVGPRAGLDDVEKGKFLTLQVLELRPLVVQPVANRYTDYAIPTRNKNSTLNYINIILYCLRYVWYIKQWIISNTMLVKWVSHFHRHLSNR
jgi:hypothetical protein